MYPTSPMLNDTRVTQEMMSDARSIRGGGGKVYLAVVDVDNTDAQAAHCVNCNGSSQLHLQHVVGGPYDVPTSGGKGTTMIYQNDSWYAAKMTVYNCPVCRPMAEL